MSVALVQKSVGKKSSAVANDSEPCAKRVKTGDEATKKTLSCTEYVDTDLLTLLVKQYDLIPECYFARDADDDHSRSEQKVFLSSFLEKAADGKRQTKYYQKSCGVGRMFGGPSFQGMRRELRHTLAREVCHDLDFVNCHPVLLEQYCQKHEIEAPTLRDFVQNRSTWLDLYMTKAQCDKAEAKKVFLMFVNGGGQDAMIRTQDSRIAEFYCEMKRIRNTVMHQRPDLLQIAKSQGKPNLPGSTTNLLLCDLENTCLLAMIDKLKLKKVHVCTPVFDGVMVKKGTYDVQQLIGELETYVAQTTGYTLKVSVKSMDEGISEEHLATLRAIPRTEVDGSVGAPITSAECRAPVATEKAAAYMAIKAEFEQTHFKCANGYYRRDPIKGWTSVTRGNLVDTYENMQCSQLNKKGESVNDGFVKCWMRDPDIRQYEHVDYYPPPIECPARHFNLWDGIYIDVISRNWSEEKKRGTDSQRANALKLRQHFLRLYSKPGQSEYMRNWYAHAYQRPGEKPDVTPIIQGTQGSGKSAELDAHNAMIGEAHSMVTENMQVDVFGPFNATMTGKLFVVLDEADLSQTRDLKNRIKGAITKKTIVINAKGQNHVTYRDFSRFIMPTNESNAVSIEHGDRRFVVFKVSDEMIGQREYFADMYDNVLKDEVALYLHWRWFMDTDLTNVNIRNRVLTEEYRDMQSMSTPYEILFLINFYFERPDISDGEIEKSKLFKEFVAYVTPQSKYQPNVRAFGMRLKSLRVEGLSTRESNGRGWYIVNKAQMLKWMVEKGYLAGNSGRTSMAGEPVPPDQVTIHTVQCSKCRKVMGTQLASSATVTPEKVCSDCVATRTAQL